jgi:outer membrane cobalamin receptor
MPIFENYPVHYAKQIEIVYGSSSSLYGADAMSGVVNIITKDRDKQKTAVEANLQAGNYGFYNTSLWLSRRIGAEFTLSVGANYYSDKQADLSKLYADLDVSHYKNNQFETIYGPMSSPTPIKSQFEAPLLAYSFWVNVKNKDLSFSLFRNSAQYSSSYSTSPQNAVYNADVFYSNRVTTGNVKYSKSIGKILFNSLLMSSYYEVDPSANYHNTYVGLAKGYKYAFGAETKLQEDIVWQINQNWQLTGGVTFEKFFSLPATTDLTEPAKPQNGLSGNYMGTNIPIKFYEVTYHNGGAFAQIRYHSEKITVNVGGRFDYNSRFKETYNPRLAFNYHPNKNSVLKLMYGSAYLAPSPLSVFQNYGSFVSYDSGKTYFSYFLHLPNPELKPMLSKALEMNFRQNITEDLSVEVGLYHNWLSNLVLNAEDSSTINYYKGHYLGYPVDYIEVSVNQGRQRNYGGSFQLDWRKRFEKGKIDAYLNVSYINGEIEEVIENKVQTAEAPLLTNFMFKTGFDFTWSKFSFSPRLIWVGEQKLSALQENSLKRQYLDGYQLLNLNLRYAFYKNSAVYVQAENALNQRYRAVFEDIDFNNPYFLKGMPQQPLRIQLGLQMKF